MNNFDYKNMTPFKWFVLENFPFIENDFEAINNYRLFSKVVEYLNKVIDDMNQVGQQTENITNAMTELQNYVNNYFDNLDVQDEIDNKLDEMVEDGTLENILSDLLLDRKFLIVGDSYAEGYTPDGNVVSWATYTKQFLGLSDEKCVIAYNGGAGIVANGTNTFYNIINNLNNDNNITDVIICGGFNDQNATLQNISSELQNLKNLIQNKFQNVKNIYLGFIAGSPTPTRKNPLLNTCNAYIHSAKERGIHYLNNVEYSLKNYFTNFSSDNYHPNQSGQYRIAMNVSSCILTGSCDVHYPYSSITFNLGEHFTSQSGNYSFGNTIKNGTTFAYLRGVFNVQSSNGFSYVANGTSRIEIGTLTAGFITGTSYSTCYAKVDVIVKNGTQYFKTTGSLLFENEKLYLILCDTNDTHGNYRTFDDIKEIQISPFSVAFDTLFC